MLQKVHQGIGRSFWIFFQHPMAGIFEDNNFSVGSDSSYLLSKDFSICLLAANRQRRMDNLV